MKHAIRNSSAAGRKAVRKAQSTFMQAVVFPAIEEVRQAFAIVERVPYMPEVEESGIQWSIDADYADIWEGRA